MSRLQAEGVQSGAGYTRQHRSQTNPTQLNGERVLESAPLSPGDEIEVAPGIRLQFDAPGASGVAPSDRTIVQQQRSGLQDVMEARMELDQRIESQFMRTSTFLDLEVVGSFRMKAAETRSERIFGSFERSAPTSSAPSRTTAAGC